MNNAVFTKTMVNIRKPRDTKLAITEKKPFGVRTKLSYYKSFSKRFVSFRNGKTEILINKAVCLGLSILELSKILMYEFCSDYVKLKDGEKAKLCYMDTGRSIVYIKTGDIYKDIAEDIETRFDSSNYELD